MRLKTQLFQTGGTNCAGLEPLTEMAEAKGLTIIGSIKIMIKRPAGRIKFGWRPNLSWSASLVGLVITAWLHFTLNESVLGLPP